jgi:hypothetical protein
MVLSAATWNAWPHDPIEKLAENLWCVHGALPRMTLRRTMTLVRLPPVSDGGARPPRVLVHSAIALDEGAMREIEAWGEPAFLVVPNAMHRLDAPAYKSRYPALRVLAPKGARQKIEHVVAVDGTLDEFPPEAGDAAARVVRFEPLAGIGDGESAMIVRSSDGATVVVSDAIFNMDRKKDLLGAFFTTAMGSAPGPRVSRLFKVLAVKDKGAFRANLERLAAMPDLVRLIVAHEKVARGPEAPQALRKAATYV